MKKNDIDRKFFRCFKDRTSRTVVLNRYFGYIFLFIAALFLSSCSSSNPELRYTIKPAVRKIILAKQFLPNGWADITVKSKQPQIRYWLVNREYSATMELRELQTDSVSQTMLLKETINVIANISLRTKIPDDASTFRVTRVPESIDTVRNFSSYVYVENGLFRRVIVFRKQQTLWELTLRQEQQTAENFESLTSDLVTFAATLYEQ